MINKVLVARADLLRGTINNYGFTFDVDGRLNTLLDSNNSFFLERQVAERSPRYKQIIPYVMLCTGLKVCTYVRGGGSGEPRLKGKRSIGFGGHIIPRDRRSPDPWLKWYFQAVRRELSEEVGVSEPKREEVIGLIMDNRSSVGRVHLGVAHLWEVAEREVSSQERHITGVTFMTVRQLSHHRDELEPWSLIALEVLRSAFRSRISETFSRQSSLFDSVSNLRRRRLGF
jgi:predicted NUDIX family phosphoesterase